MNNQLFIHLNLHSEYSIVDGIVRIDALMQECAQKDMPAVAVTDRCNFFGLVKFYKAALNNGIKPIIGVEVYLQNSTDLRQPFKLLCLAQNETGYQNLIKLISRAYIDGQELGQPLVQKSWLAELNGGIIVLSGGMLGDIGVALKNNEIQVAKQILTEWMKIFPQRFYLELQRTGKVGEEDYIHAALKLASEHKTSVVATNAVCFLNIDDVDAHEARVCIHAGYVLDDKQRPRHYTGQQYFRSTAEMIKLFNDIPEAITNTVEIAKRCNVELTLNKTFLPIFPVPEGTTIETYFALEARNGLERRLHALFDTQQPDFLQQRKIYDKRLELELGVINHMGFPSYFLIVADFIAWAKKNGIPVGPGRGSGAGSLVAYVLGITDLDPIEHELLFERFLNPERVSLPDFDIDFCMEGRDRVIEYVINRYGKDHVSQIITYGTMAARAVVRDVGRVLAHPYGFVDKIAKLIPFEIGITLEKALQDEETLRQRYNDESDVKSLIDLAMKLEGITRNAGKHAGGVVIAPSLLTDFMPLYREQNDANLVSQFDKNDVETIGLVKFDFLGLRTLTIIDWALRAINQKLKNSGEELLDIVRIPLDDVPSYKLLQSCATTAVFQLESRGMRDLIKRLKPDRFSDIVALVALFRPGPLQSGMVDDFIERKHGQARVLYMHPRLEPILKPTYGVILYQEQVMQIAQVLAGYSLGGADILRRAMGKKKPEEMVKQRAIFLEGAMKQNIDKHVANNIFDLMEKFAGYGFNKSHSAAYALIAYQTAWLKTHYPAEFMAAVLSSDMDNTDKVVHFLNECKNMRLKVLPPKINHSDYQFGVNENGEIVYGLGAIKGAGLAALDNILLNRKEFGSYKNIYDFCKRVDGRKVNRRVLEALIRAGVLDDIGPHRASILATLPLAMKAAEQYLKNKSSGQLSLFDDLLTEGDEADAVVSYIDAPVWSEEERLKGEKNVLGFYLTGHPIERYRPELAKMVSLKIGDIVGDSGRETSFRRVSGSKNIVIAGFVAALKVVTTRTGNRLAILNIEDGTGNMDITIFSEVYLAARNHLIEDQLLLIEGEVGVDNYSGEQRLRATKVMTFDEARNQYAKALILCLNAELLMNNGADSINTLHKLLAPHRGGKCPVYISYQNQGAAVKLFLGDAWRVLISEEMLQVIRQQFGEEVVVLNYGK